MLCWKFIEYSRKFRSRQGSDLACLSLVKEMHGPTSLPVTFFFPCTNYETTSATVTTQGASFDLLVAGLPLLSRSLGHMEPAWFLSFLAKGVHVQAQYGAGHGSK